MCGIFFFLHCHPSSTLKCWQFHSSLAQVLSGLFRKHLFPLNRWQTICSGLNTDSDSVMKMAAAFLIPQSKPHSRNHLDGNWLNQMWTWQVLGMDAEVHAHIHLQKFFLSFGPWGLGRTFKEEKCFLSEIGGRKRRGCRGHFPQSPASCYSYN